VVVTWNAVYQYNTNTPYTFQVILFENGEFKYQYGNDNASGSNATIGVQVSNSDITQYSYNSGYNANGVAIRWVVPSTTAARVAEYRFDEFSYSGSVGEVRDTSGNGHGGVRLGSAVSTAAGYVCRGLDVPANTSTGSSGVDTLLSMGSAVGAAGTLSLWVKSNAAWTSTTAAMLADATLASSRPFNLMRLSGGALRLTVSDSAGTSVSTSTAAQSFGAGTWVHVAATWRLAAGLNQTVLRLYVNGVLSATAFGTTTGSLDPTLGTLVLGDNRSSNTTSGTPNSANGQLDEVRIYNFEATVADLATDMANTHTCAPPVDHYELSLPSSAVVCVGSTVTVNACADSSSPCTNRSTALSGQTATLVASGLATVTPLVTFDSTGVGRATLSYPTAADNTAVTVTLSGEQTPALSARQCCPDGVACAAANSCSINFKTAGFVVAASAGGSAATVPAQTAGTAATGWFLRAVKSNTSTQSCEAALTGSNTVDWAYQCQNPATCNGSRLSLTGTSTSTIAGNPATGVVSTTSVGMSFDGNGNAPFSFNHADVGLVNLVASKATTASLLVALAGRSNSFVVKPAGFSVSAIQQAAAPNLANPAAASATGARFVKAGEAFSATITALTSSGATAPSFGRETSPEGALLAPTLVLPSGGYPGSLSNGSIAGGSFSSGVATVSNLSYSEVGILTLNPSVASGSYLGAGAVSGTASGNVGRFVPAKFVLSGGSVTHRSALACSPASSFSYLGDNFRLAFTLTAQNTAGGTTQNYTGSFAKLDPTSASAWNVAGLGGSTSFSTASARLSLGTATGSFSAGAAAVTLTANAVRASSPDGPFAAAFGVAPADSDGVALASLDMASTSGGSNDRGTVANVALRMGRLRLSNAMGAADRALALPATLQSWTGSAWDVNTLDSCTTVAASAANFGNLRKTLTLADLNVSGAIAINSGLGTLKLAPPGGGRSGTVDVALSLGSSSTDASCLQSWTPAKAATSAANQSHLRGAWCGSSVDKDPSARASFGLQRTQENTVYRREMY
jgi:MSHA biogenesis protein MshQ